MIGPFLMELLPILSYFINKIVIAIPPTFEIPLNFACYHMVICILFLQSGRTSFEEVIFFFEYQCVIKNER